MNPSGSAEGSGLLFLPLSREGPGKMKDCEHSLLSCASGIMLTFPTQATAWIKGGDIRKIDLLFVSALSHCQPLVVSIGFIYCFL